MSQPDNIDRLPPHSIEAEQALLGCIFLAPDETIPVCITRIAEDTEVFYDLRHKRIYEILIQMYDEREPIDTVTVMTWMQFQGCLEEVGGISYLSQLPSFTPSAANLPSYLQTVLDHRLSRKLIKLAAETTAAVYDNADDPTALAQVHAQEAMDLTQSLLTDEERPILELVNESIDRIERWTQNPGSLTGIPSGFQDIDRVTTGFQDGDMIVLAARPSMGKAQPLTCRVATPYGFMPIGCVSVGDYVIGKDGTPKKVIGVFPQGLIPVFDVKMSDGTETRCSSEHLWFTQTRNERRKGCIGSVKTLSQIASTIRRGDGCRRNHVIPVCQPIQFKNIGDLPLNPWLLGALLGDGKLKSGNVMFSKPEVDVQEKVSRALPEGDEIVFNGMDGRVRRKHRNNEISDTKVAIIALGLNVDSEDKFIPEIYLRASAAGRLELLRGLLDTDGFVNGTSVEFSTSSRRLSENVAFLVRSLGGVCSLGKTRNPNFTYKGIHKTGLTSYRMQIWFLDGTVPVSSSKHLGRWKQTSKHCHKSIVEITPSGQDQCVCIMIDDPDGLYVTDDFIVTHNTSLAMNMATNVAINFHLPVGVFSLEMTSESLTTRMICSEARVNLRLLQAGHIAQTDFPKLTTAAGRVAHAPIHINDRSGLSILGLRTRARKMHRMHGIKLMVIDYLQLMNSGHRKSGGNRQEEVAEISSGVKALAKELHIPIIVLSQLNRELEKEKNRKPRMSDLRESGAIEQDADIVGFLYKPPSESEDQEEEASVPVNLLIAKQRNGPTADIPLVFIKTWCRFESAAHVSHSDVPFQDEQPPLPEYGEQGQLV